MTSYELMLLNMGLNVIMLPFIVDTDFSRDKIGQTYKGGTGCGVRCWELWRLSFRKGCPDYVVCA